MQRSPNHSPHPITHLTPKLVQPSSVRGNPIHIGGVVVWRVVDAAAATLNIQRCNKFVASQSEAAFRLLASRYPYDSYNGEMSLLGHTEEIGNELREQIVARLHGAGVEILESTLTHLSYAPEICQAMLQRQQVSYCRVVHEMGGGG